MIDSQTNRRNWSRMAGVGGAAGVLCYFAAAFIPLPDTLTRLLAFAFGPLLCVAFLGLYRLLSAEEDGPTLQLAALFGIIAGVVVTAMLVVQVGNNMVRTDLLASAPDGPAEEAVRTAWGAVNRVQYLLDVVWDIFICLATALIGVVMLSHSRFGKIWGGTGILSGLGLLALNLESFPYGPADDGSIDLGPVVALWMLAVFIRVLVWRESRSN